MERWVGRVAVVTGASAGIGAAIVEDLVESGMVVVGLARRIEKLEELKAKLKGKKGTLHCVKTDITKDEEVKATFLWVKENLGGVDVLVNNAGVLIRGLLHELDINEWRKIYAVNVFAVGACTKEALNSMMDRNVEDGHIIIINSVGSHRISNQVGSVVYSSSKFASKALTEGLRRELVAEKSTIKVTSISPGFVDSELFSANGAAPQMDISSMPHCKPKDIAGAVHYTLASPHYVQINELIIRSVGEGV